MTTIVITGASRGLGAALLRRLADTSSVMVVIGRSHLSEGLPPTADVRPLLVDLRELAHPQRWRWLTTEIQRLLGPRLAADGILFINNAGTVHPIGAPDEHEPEEVIDATLINYLAPLATLRALVATARPYASSVHVLNITSGASQRPIGGWTSYCGTKAGIRMAFDAALSTYEGLSVEHVDPGALDGTMQEDIRNTQNTFPHRDMFGRWALEGRLRSFEAAADDIFNNYLVMKL